MLTDNKARLSRKWLLVLGWGLVLILVVFASPTFDHSTGDPDLLGRFMPVPGETTEDLGRLEEYWSSRITYPTGNYNPEWLRRAARQDARIPRSVPAGTRPNKLPEGVLGLDPNSFTSLGPSPINMTGCNNCYNYTKTMGRINSIVIDPTDTNVAYAASTGGGVWKTDNCCSSATTWRIVTDDPLIANIAIDDLTLDPNDRFTVYAATGDLNFGSFSMGSQGILKSTDGGATWTVLGADVFSPALPQPAGQFPQYQAVGKVRVDPNNSNRVVAGAKTGIYISYNGGTDWTGPCLTNTYSAQRQDITGLELSNVGGSTRILAAVGVRGFATAVQYNLNQNGANGIYSATMPNSDCPTFTSIATNANGFVFGTSVTGSAYSTGANMNAGTGSPYVSTSSGNQVGRIELAVAPSDANVIYAQVQSIAANSNTGCGSSPGCQLGVWVTTNGGSSWSFLSGSAGGSLRSCTNGQGDYAQNWYDQAIAVDPNNSDRIFVSTYEVWFATRTGTSFNNLTCAYSYSGGVGPVHSDQHALAFAPGSSSTLLIGNDGGVHGTTNANAATSSVDPTWFNMDNGFNTVEFYSGDISANFATASAPYVNGGAQDNGSMSALFSGSPTGPVQWQSGVGGDGFYARIDPLGERFFQGGNSGHIYRCASGCTSGGATWTDLSSTGNWLNDTQSFILPYEVYKGTPSNAATDCSATTCNHMLVGTVRVWETVNSYSGTGTSFYVNSPANLTKQTLGTRSFINQLAYAPTHSGWAIAGTNDGNVQIGRNLGTGSIQSTWVDVTGGNAVLPNRPILDVWFDAAFVPTSATSGSPVAYAAVGGFDENTPSTTGHVFRVICTTNCATFTWENKTGNLPNIPVDSIIANPNYPQQVFAGTDFGLYFTDDITAASPMWYRFTNGMPSVMVWDMQIDRGATALSVWTRGRGAFVYPLSSGPVAGVLQGTVRRASDNAPVNGATVTLGSSTTKTNNSGFYQFVGYAAGSFSVTASCAGYNGSTVNNVSITGNQTTTQDFTLSASASGNCFADSSQAEFQAGTANNVDTATSSGDVKLTIASGTLDQQQTTLSFFVNGINTTSWVAQTFVPGSNGFLTSVDMQLALTSGGTVGPVVIQLRNTVSGSPGSTVLASATVNNVSSTSNAWYNAVFSSPPSLSTGTTYALVVSASSGGDYRAVRSNNNAYANGVYLTSSDSGGNWSAQSQDLAFRTYMSTGYVSSGTWISPVRDANPGSGATANWTTLSWTASAPANTSVRFQVGASNSATGPFNFVGPDGTSSTYFTTSGAFLSQFSAKRYLKIKAYLSTSNAAATPTLSDVTVCYSNTTPTLVELVRWRAKLARDGQVRLRWQTGAETNIAAFNLWRSGKRDGTYHQINAEPIAAKQMGTFKGAKYARRDQKIKPGKTYYYKLEIVRADDSREWSEIKRVRVPSE